MQEFKLPEQICFASRMFKRTPFPQPGSFAELCLNVLQAGLIKVRVVRPGQATAMEAVRAPREVQQSLVALGISPDLTVQLRDSAEISMGRTDIMLAGEYTLTVAQPQGEPQSQT